MTDFKTVADAVLKVCPDTVIMYDEPMCRHTSFHIGGTVPILFVPKSEMELLEILKVLSLSGIKPLVIGRGTNVLIEEGQHSFPVIMTYGGLSEIRMIDEERISASSGAALSHVAQFALEHGLEGMEFAHGIPGSVGGAVFMNAGAYGGEIKDITESVNAISLEGDLYTYNVKDCDFSYRHSAFCENGQIIVNTVFKLQHGDCGLIKNRMEELASKRRNSQPLDKYSAGSTFKRPEGGYAAAMIDEAGLKGYRVGGAQVSDKHAGFVVNLGDATFNDVMSVIDHVREKVYIKTGRVLMPEIMIIRRGRDFGERR